MRSEIRIVILMKYLALMLVLLLVSYTTFTYESDSKYNTDTSSFDDLLDLLEEPSLKEISTLDKNAVIYRLTAEPFLKSHYSIRFEVNPDGSGIIHYAETKGPREPHKIVRQAPKYLNQKEATALLTSISEIKFWSLPSNPPPTPIAPEDADYMSEDVVICVNANPMKLEGVYAGKYHVIGQSCNKVLGSVPQAFKVHISAQN